MSMASYALKLTFAEEKLERMGYTIYSGDSLLTRKVIGGELYAGKTMDNDTFLKFSDSKEEK